MGLLDQILFGMGFLTVFFAFITLLYIKKNREYERLELESGLNALLFGMFFLFISIFIDFLVYLDKTFFIFSAITAQAGTYLGYLVNISNIALVPLFAVCFLVAILLIRKHLPRMKKSEE